MKRRPWNNPPTQPAKKDTSRRRNDRLPGALGSLKVKLMPEYNVELPLWGCSWQRLGLDASLLDRLADWQSEFDDNFDAYKGWKLEEARSRRAERADELVAELRVALKGIPLEVDLWPLDAEQ